MGPPCSRGLLAALAVALAALAVGCGSSSTDARSAHVSLVVRLDPDGPGGPKPARELKLDCDQPSQSLACGAAAGVSPRDVRPVAKGTACASIFGGPQTAKITGTIRGNPVDASFSRRDGCQIARWDHVADLLGQVP